MQVKLKYVEGIKDVTATYKEQAVVCPFCKSEVIPVLKVFMTDHNVDGADMRFLAKFPCCSNEYFVNCDKGYYHYGSGISTQSDAKWTAEELPEKVRQKKAFPEIIRQISPSFEQIYNEAYAAQQAGLNQICGGGYRKALEFLIKDYAAYLHPEKAEEIRKMELGNCVAQYVDCDSIKDFANRASWLGNDELHYLRKWEGKDLVDLIILVDQSVLAIEFEEKRKSLLADMPDPKKQKK